MDYDIDEPTDSAGPGPVSAHDFVKSARVAAPRDHKGQLEISQCWGELLVDTRTLPLIGENGQRRLSVTIGPRTAPFWRLLGVEMGPVPRPLGVALPYVFPLWSEVAEQGLDDFQIPASLLPGETEAQLVETDDEGVMRVVAPEGWTLTPGGEARPDGSTAAILVPGLAVTVSRDHHQFVVTLSEVAQRVVSRTEALDDGGFYALVGTLAMILLITAIGVSQLPHVPKAASRSLDDDAIVMILAAEKPPAKIKPASESGAKAKDKEGVRGEKKAPKDPKSGDSKKAEKDSWKDAGLMAAFQDDALASLSEASLNPGLAAGVKGLIGPRGVQQGSGWGVRGMDPGGGGNVEGWGGLGPIGPGPGKGPGGPGGDGLSKVDGEIPPGILPPVVIGNMPRSLIDEVIKRHLPMIRYCYERELQKNSGLQGKVSIKFVIAKDGTVSSASLKETTLDNAAAEQCIAGRFMRMQFPAPKGGGIAVVTYPFLFHAPR